MNDTSGNGRGDRRQLATFVLTGGAAAAVNLAARWLFSRVMIYEVAVTLAYLIGMTAAFLLARRFVFEPSARGWLSEYRRFALVNVVSFFIVLGVSVGLARFVFPMIGFHWHAEDAAHVIGVGSPILISYYAHKRFSFAKGSKLV